MGELREAVAALFEIKGRMPECEDPPSRSQMLRLQKSVDDVQQNLNRLQTAMDAWSEETESI
jgi:hypothetical protein